MVFVDHQGDRSLEECANALSNGINSLKAIVYISVLHSASRGAYPFYEPVEGNDYHSLLKQVDGSIPLTPSIAKKLSRNVNIWNHEQ